MFIKLLIISAILVGVALAGLALSTLVRREGTFPEIHISRNKEMRKRGITCAQQTDMGCKPVDVADCCCGCVMNSD
jgi:hypothetical protein